MSQVDINWDDICTNLDSTPTTTRRTKFTPEVKRLIQECHKRGIRGAVISKKVFELFNIELSRSAINEYIFINKEKWS